ncbi:MAG: c-type cytochrome [bacterium]|nr:c-type cytochrome [bacterium]
MRRTATGLALAALATVVGACARPTTPAAPPAAAAAADAGAIFHRRCAACHGDDARGDGPVAPTLRTPPPDLTRLAADNGGVFPRTRVIDVVSGEIPIAAHGTRDMPVWSLRFRPSSGAATAASLWSTRQLELLTSYLETIQVPASAATSPAGSR